MRAMAASDVETLRAVNRQLEALLPIDINKKRGGVEF